MISFILACVAIVAIAIIALAMHTIEPSISGASDTAPKGHVCMDSDEAPIAFKTGQADLKVGMVINYVSTGFDRVDAAADTLSKLYHLEVPMLPTAARTDPMTDYVYEQYETAFAYALKKGYRGWFRCKDDSQNIDFGNTLICDTTNQGMLKRDADAASIDSGTTAVTSTAANGQIVTGENVPQVKFKALIVTQRTASATESWVLAEVTHA